MVVLVSLNTTTERTYTDARHAVGDGYRGQTGTTTERTIFDARHAAGDGNRGQTGAIRERMMTYARNAFGDGDRGQTGATPERTRTNARHAVGDYSVLTTCNQSIACRLYNCITILARVIIGVIIFYNNRG